LKKTFIFPLSIFFVFTAAAASETQTPAPNANSYPPAVKTILGRDVNEWIEFLKTHEDPEKRKTAMVCLADFGPAAADAVEELLAVSADEIQPENQRWAAITLAAIGPAAKPALGPLLAILNNSTQPSHRAAACNALAQIAPEDSRVRKAVLHALQDKCPEVRAEAIDAAATIAPFDSAALPALGKLLLNAEMAKPAAVALLCAGPGGLPTLLRGLEEGGSRTREAAASALHQLGSSSSETLPALLKALKHEGDAKAQMALALAASRLAPRDQAVLETLAERLALSSGSNDDEAEKNLAAEEMRVLVAAGERALPALQKILRARDNRIRLSAVGLLAQLPATAESVADLVARSQDKDRLVSLAAIKALNDLGPLAASAHSALEMIAANEGDDESVRHAAILAALNTGRAPNEPRHRSWLDSKDQAAVIKLLQKGDAEARREAAAALRGRADDTGAVASALLDALDDPDDNVRSAAAHSLVTFGNFARVALPKLANWLETGAPALQKSALVALAGMGVDAKPALPSVIVLVLCTALDDDDSLRGLLAIVLRQIGPEAAPLLAEKLKCPLAPQRARAAEALGAMGEVGAPAIPDLIELAKSAVDSDAQAACAALRDMGPVAYSLAAEFLAKTLRADVFAERRKWAVWALGGIKTPPEGDKAGVIDALCLALLDEDESVCRAAHSALVAIGPPALPKLRELLKQDQGEAPYWAVRVMARMKADPGEILPRLAELTQPGKRDIERGTAAEFIENYAPEHTEMIPVLLRVLGDREDFVAHAAMRTLSLFGTQALSPLKSLLHQRNPLLRQRALEALDMLQSQLEGQK
jgi:HEAT repeat protein